MTTKLKYSQAGFTLIEIAIVLLIVAILLGYTVALFPQQQRLKQYRAVESEMDRVVEAIIGYAQVNGRLPCPALPASAGIEDINAGVGCNNYGGFVPINTLGIDGRLNADSLLLDPWGNPYRYYVTDVDFDIPVTAPANGISDFTGPGEMRAIGIGDADGDGLPDLDGRYIVCDGAGGALDSDCDADNEVFGRYDAGPPIRYEGAPFVLVSMGQNWNEAAPAGEELVNSGATLIVAGIGVAAGPSGGDYVVKNVGAGETTFVRPLDGFRDDFDDVVRWASPSVLFSRMIQADQLP